MCCVKGKEGYLLIENPNGVPFGDPAAALLSNKVWIAPPPMPVYENATITCNHCHQVFLKNSHRKRERAWCWSCDRYLCDRCAALRAVIGCRTMAEVLERYEKMVLA